MWCSTHRRRLVHLFRSENGPRRRRTLGGLSYRVGGLSYRVGVLSAGSVTESDIGEISPYFAGRKRCSHRMAVSSHPMRSASGGLIVIRVIGLPYGIRRFRITVYWLKMNSYGHLGRGCSVINFLLLKSFSATQLPDPYQNFTIFKGQQLIAIRKWCTKFQDQGHGLCQG